MKRYPHRKTMEIRPTTEDDWMHLKTVRLAALLESPTAFGVTYRAAAAYTQAQWRERASGAAGPDFWLALRDGRPVGMIGGGTNAAQRYKLIGMWVEPTARGLGVAARLVEAVKARALEKGHARVYLDVVPDNARAANFYLRQGFAFIDEWEPLASHPQILVQTMVWTGQLENDEWAI
jgi:GNAT superfamily N-acetyltransferase